MIGTTFTHNGVTLVIHAGTPDNWELWSVGGAGGVWFATDAQLEAVGVHVA